MSGLSVFSDYTVMCLCAGQDASQTPSNTDWIEIPTPVGRSLRVFWSRSLDKTLASAFASSFAVVARVTTLTKRQCCSNIF